MASRVNMGKQALVFFLILLVSTAVAAEVRVYNLTYDQVGNLQQGFGQYYEHNEFNQLLRVRDNGPTGTILEEYVYDHEGQRLKKHEPLLNQTTYYFNDNYIRVVNSTGTYQYVYYYENDVLVGREDPDGRKFFHHPDILGSTDLVTNESGDIVEETTYEPHGEVIEGGQTSEFLYTSKELDDQTGLYYFGARYYNPSVPLFTQPDDTITDIYNPQDLNRYAYVRNNPYKYVDPDGGIPIPIIVGLASGAISAGISAYSQYRATGTVRFGETAKAFGVGAVAGLTGYGAGAFAGSALSGFGSGVAVLGGGALSGAVGGEAFTATEAVLSGQQYSFDPNRATLNSLIGLGTAGLGYKFSKSSVSQSQISISERQLQAKFKHASDFGIEGSYNKENAARFRQAIDTFVSSKDTTAIKGTYRGAMQGTHYFNQRTNQWVFKDSKSNFVSGWKLSKNQARTLRARRNVR